MHFIIMDKNTKIKYVNIVLHTVHTFCKTTIVLINILYLDHTNSSL